MSDERSNSNLKQGVKGIFSSTFWQLVVVYTALVVLISFSLFWKYSLHFELFAVVIAVIGAMALYHSEDDEKEKLDKHLHYMLLALGILIVLTFRMIPYLNGNTIPLGYDAGIYKYGIESFSAQGFGVDDWVKSAMSPGFLYLLVPLLKMGVSSEFILTWAFIFFGVLLGVSIYFAGKAYFGNRTAVIALLLYAVSAIQFKVFTYMYYKNVIALAFLFFALYFLKRNEDFRASVFSGAHSVHKQRVSVVSAHPPALKRDGNDNSYSESGGAGKWESESKSGEGTERLKGWNFYRFFFIVFGVLVGIMHLPTFFIFGVAYVLFIFYNRKNFGKKFVDGALILGLTLLLYVGFWNEAILPLIKPVAESFVEPGTAPGTFISFFVYQFSTLYILPFAILGFAHLLWQRKFDMLFFLTLVTGIIVYFQFFFFNRFIIHLDVFLIVLAASAFSLMIANSKKLGIAILVLMLVSSGYVAFQDSVNAKPLITEESLNLIKMINLNVEGDARIMVVSSEYSPWVLAYSNRGTIAPGLFEENKWTQADWEKFWNSNSTDETKSLMSVYPKGEQVYIFVGTKSFNNPCFSEFLSNGSSKLLRYNCE